MIDLKNIEVINSLFNLGQNGNLDKDALTRSLEIVNYNPNKDEWRDFLTTIFLVLGVGFLATGVIFFFAYNWADLSKFSKFSIIEVALIITTTFALLKKSDSLVGKVLLLLSVVLTGVFLAIFGQTYQTGADAYQLFMGWTLLVSGWVIISKFLPIWTVFIILINISIILFWYQTISSYGVIVKLYEILIITNALFLFLFEFFQSKKVEWLKGRWSPRILHISLCAYFVSALFSYIFKFERALEQDYIKILCPLLFVFFIGLTLYFYQNHKKDLFMITTALLSIIILFTTLIGNQIIDGFKGFIVLAILVIGQGAGAAVWLKNIYQSWEIKNEEL